MLKTKAPEYLIWKGMISRCHCPTSTSFIWYGAKGVQVCDAWRSSFQEFLGHVGPRPSKIHSLERLRNDRGYEPGNVRWATWSEQMRNHSNNRLITINGVTRCLTEWIEVKGCRPGVIFSRLKRGETPQQALSRPAIRPYRWRASKAQIEHNGQTKSIAEWAKESDVKYSTLCSRLRKGWPVQDALSKAPRPGGNPNPRARVNNSIEALEVVGVL